MVHGIAAPGLAAKQYYHRYGFDSVDLCDVLSSFSAQDKATLHELSCALGLGGKEMTGADVERYYRDGRTQEISEYCKADCRYTYRIWLRYQLFLGRLDRLAFEESEADLADYLLRQKRRAKRKSEHSA
jgi:predicted PolB exonuclease-like 3'-5' exonuclease